MTGQSGLAIIAPGNELAAGDWVASAACAGTPVTLWFPEGVGARRATARAIARYCDACPVRRECGEAGAREP